MNTNDLPRILLHTSSMAKKSQWNAVLFQAKLGRLLTEDEGPTSEPFEILVTDGSLPAPRDLANGSLRLFGVIAIGSTMAADVTLPDDFTPRELTLACQLLGEIVRLRRDRHDDHLAHQRLAELATRDPLTGIANRRAWDDELARRISGGSDLPRPCCLVLLDVDHFKDVNDTWGHAVGDEVLRQIARALTSNVRDRDFVARLGGDEFGMLLADVPADRGWSVVERIRGGIQPFVASIGRPEVTMSAGLAIRFENLDGVALCAEADAFLRQAKAAGRNRTTAST